MGRSPCCTKVGLRRGPWSTEEDTILTTYIQEQGEGQWKSLPKNAGLLRCGKSCRLRWMNYLRPDIKRGNISQDEEDLIVRLHGLLGNRWSLIAGRLPGRTDNEIKNYWNTYLVKKLKNTGIISPKSHKPPKANKKKKIEKQKKVITTTTTRTTKKKMSDIITSDEEQVLSTNNDPPKTKVYMPKAIRVSSEFSRTGSNDSLSTSTIEWPPLCELEDGFLGFGPTLSPPLHHQHYMDLLSGDDVNMWDNVYDEYFQLL